jgi:hypothetical protein
MDHGLASAGLSPRGMDTVCETCESDIDFPDDYADLGVCRQCGVAFLIDPPAAAAENVS